MLTKLETTSKADIDPFDIFLVSLVVLDDTVSVMVVPRQRSPYVSLEEERRPENRHLPGME
jgi:hypothetical protein